MPTNKSGVNGDSVEVQSATVNGLLDAGSVETTALNSGGTVTDGDGTERQVWIIASGASDPSGADPEDLIFEEQ